jgi:nitrogen-specific signal transduction histidine kinase
MVALDPELTSFTLLSIVAVLYLPIIFFAILRRFKGCGSGLALSKGIVEAHDGLVWVESPGNDEVHFPGSQFHVLIPLAKLADGESQKMSAPLKVSL